MYDISLFLHIVGSVVVFLLSVTSIFGMMLGWRSSYYSLALSLAAASCFQLLSGTLMFWSVGGGSDLFAFCERIGIYFGITLLVEALLMVRIMQEKSFLLRKRYILWTLSPGIVSVIITIVTSLAIKP